MAVCRAFAILVVCSALAACSSDPAPITGNQDGGADAGVHDGGADAGPDAGPPVGAPGAPTLSGTTSFPDVVDLKWTAADALASNFQILRATNGSAFTRLAQVPSTTLSYTDSTLAVGHTDAAYKVTASNSVGTGPASNAVEVLAAPFDLIAGGSDTRIVLKWSPTDHTDSYDIYRGYAGEPMWIGNTMSNDFVDTSGVTAGETYTYSVVSKPAADAGSLPSGVSNPAGGLALGLDVTANQIFVSDTSEESKSLAPSLFLEARNVDGGPLVNDAGAPVLYGSITSGNTIVVPGVPHGTYALTVEGYHDYAIGTARAVDYSQVTPGRSNVQPASPATQIAYNLTALAPWSTGEDGGVADAIEAISLGAHNFSYDLAHDVSTPPVADATAFVGTEALGSDSDSNLISADAGDQLYIFQLHAKTSANGVQYQAPAGVISTSHFTTLDAATTQFAQALSAPTALAIPTFDFPRSAYLDPTHATLNPAATNARQHVYLEQEKGFAAHGWYSNDSLADGLVIAIPQDGGTTQGDGGVDLNVGAVTWAQPVPAWDSFVLVQSSYDVPMTITFQDNSTTPSKIDTAHATYTAYSSTTVPMVGSAFANSALTPTLSAPRAPLLNGTSAFTAQANISATSRLSWTAPALGTPGYYLVVIYEVVPQTLDNGNPVQDGNGNYLTDTYEVASFTTTSTSVSLAADLVRSGISYFAVIDSIVNATAGGAIDGTVKPYTLGPIYSSVETVTNLFTIAAPPPARAGAHAKAALRSARDLR
jgi:hypothetical protein